MKTLSNTQIKRLIIVFLTFCSIQLNGQTVRIESEKLVKDDQFHKTQSIIPIYRYVSDSIEPYSKFGLEIDSTLPWYKINKLPDMTNCTDTGYSYIYFAGADNELSKGYLLTLIGNYRRSRRTIYFFIDRNNDFNFTNDGPPDSMTYFDHTKEIVLANRDIPEAKYAIKLTRFKYGENVAYKNLLSKHYRNHSGKKRFTDINYCFREQRYNCIAAHYKSDVDSFTIGIKDMNVNGIYNESCIDKLYVGPYKREIVAEDLFDLTPTINKNAFEWNGKKYRFESIETTGSFIEITEDDKATLSNKLEIGKKAPNFEYFNVLNVKHQLKEFKKKEVYLFFWDKDNLTSEDTLYLSKIDQEYKETLKLITLNHGDEPKQVRIMFYYDKIKWPVGYSNSEIGSMYFLEDVNRGYYLGKKRKLKNDKLTPKEMYEILQNSQEK
ncbi:MAG: peroxiredoxin family protein [Bacteroidia bacterium]|nr:peroxiredoxin family protein [Bacteroidia bacterium]